MAFHFILLSTTIVNFLGSNSEMINRNDCQIDISLLRKKRKKAFLCHSLMTCWSKEKGTVNKPIHKVSWDFLSFLSLGHFLKSLLRRKWKDIFQFFLLTSLTVLILFQRHLIFHLLLKYCYSQVLINSIHFPWVI